MLVIDLNDLDRVAPCSDESIWQALCPTLADPMIGDCHPSARSREPLRLNQIKLCGVSEVLDARAFLGGASLGQLGLPGQAWTVAPKVEVAVV